MPCNLRHFLFSLLFGFITAFHSIFIYSCLLLAFINGTLMRLWFSGQNVINLVNPAKLHRNRCPPDLGLFHATSSFFRFLSRFRPSFSFALSMYTVIFFHSLFFFLLFASSPYHFADLSYCSWYRRYEWTNKTMKSERFQFTHKRTLIIFHAVII